MTTIYWFRRDRRLSDNPALATATASDKTLLPLTLLEREQNTSWGFPRLGRHRHTFEAQALAGLARDLTSLGSALYQPEIPGIDGLIDVAKRNKAGLIVCEEIHAPEEQQALKTLREAGLTVSTVEQSALLPHRHLPFEVDETPKIFSEFRRLVEKSNARPRSTLPTIHTLPPLPDRIKAANPWNQLAQACRVDTHPDAYPEARSSFLYQAPSWHGDETSAQNHLRQYFSSDRPQRYKQTRNALSGTDDSTKFSPWLAVGAVSAAQIWDALKDHEHRCGANDSTYWIWFELLWRDHFRLMMQRFGTQLFHRSGLTQQNKSGAVFSAEGFERWRIAQTGHDLIDAGMRELAATGYLSNRMRQIVASYLIHEMQGDWLAGAAWFEHCLIDFDVHSNQGNWAYIAGVGTDPRGGRRFNPDKQAAEHDTNGQYRKLWSAA